MIAKDLESYCKRIEEIEASYWKTDGKMLDVTDNIIISLWSKSDYSDNKYRNRIIVMTVILVRQKVS